MVSRRRNRILIYVQHLLGIGHLMRARRLAGGLVSEGYEVTLVTGGLPIDQPNADFDEILLPAMAVKDGDFSQLVDDTGHPIDDAFRNRRSEALQEIVRKTEPEILIFEAFPFGRRQVRFELLPLLEHVKNLRPRPLVVSSIRDILQVRHKPHRDQETVELIHKYFDGVLVHGDPAFVTLDDSFSLAQHFKDKTYYTGLVSSNLSGADSEKFSVIVSAGGGAVGQRLLLTAISASKQFSDLGPWCIIAGPNCSQYEFDHLVATAPGHVVVERFRPDFPDLLQRTELSISQAGYNTVSDVLQANCRAILVPYSAHGETEQMMRATRLSELGRIELIKEDELTAEQLIASIEHSIADLITPSLPLIQTNGIERTAEILDSFNA